MDAVWIGVALVVAVAGGWPVTAGLLKFATSKTVRAVDDAESGAADASEGPAEAGSVTAAPEASALEASALETSAPRPRVEVLRGGLLIGFLERGAVAVAIFSGQPVAIAYVVAIKGLGRYPELKDTPAASERFIIGTLASMLWAASVAAVTKALLL
ncbi:hypothetical protein [Arthrobacter glacialis]|uniref:hypothetical protein n=1 Tax=Arthrobacter glacialis TaxID=1664 RepID=UPI000CD3B7F2|nr:hypothetical protein [Arthrobacter glacialis]POH58099.1 hypothetical protein CVS28_13365 [Arthrobacter glacialis]